MRKFIKIAKNNHKTTFICVDAQKAEEILQYILSDNVIKDFDLIKRVLLENLRNPELYKKVVSLDDIFEMRLRKKGKNDRIYCKELRDSKRRYIVMRELYKKKKQDNIPANIMKKLKQLEKDNYEI